MPRQSLILKLLKQLKSPNILVVGDVMVDNWYYGDYERETEEYGYKVKICDIEETVVSCGGAANVARHVASLGGKCTLAGVVGMDHWASEAYSTCQQAGVAPLLITDATRPTTVKTRVIEEGKDYGYRFDCEKRHRIPFCTEEPLRERIKDYGRQASLILISDYNKGVVTENIVRAAVETGKSVVVDPKGMDFRKYEGVDLIKPNFAEYSESVLSDLNKRFPLVVTRGAQGIEYWQSDPPNVERLSAWDVPIVDAIGAGDATVAGLVMGLASGLKVQHAKVVANLAGAVSVMLKGGQGGVTKEQMEEVVEKYTYKEG